MQVILALHAHAHPDLRFPRQLRSQFAQAFRATGITAYLTNKGTLETAQHIANHESLWTTRIYGRRRDEISLDEVEEKVIGAGRPIAWWSLRNRRTSSLDAQNRTRRISNNAVGMRPQPAQVPLRMPAADDDQIGALPKSGFADDRGHCTTRQQDFHIDFGFAAQTSQSLFGCVKKVFAKFYFATIAGGLVRGRDCVNHFKRCVAQHTELQRPPDHGYKALVGVYRANDLMNIGLRKYRSSLVMDSRQNWAIHVVQHLRRNRPEQEPAKSAMSAGRHHNE